MTTAASAHHTIVSVAFVDTAARGLPSSEAPLECSCGEVTTSGEYTTHRGPSEYVERKRFNNQNYRDRKAAP